MTTVASSSRIPFSLIRFKRTFFTLLKNKMALTGFILLVLFSVTAIAAPLISPYRPQGEVVSGVLDPPSWIVYVTGNSGWSQNAQFSSPSVTANGVSLTVVDQSSNSMDLRATTQGMGGVVRVVENLTYPQSDQYPGAPKRFFGDVQVSSPGLAGSVQASVFVEENIAGSLAGNWTLWNQNITGPGVVSPLPSIDSQDYNLVKRLGLESSSLTLAQVIFSKKAFYTYTLELDLPPGQNVYTFSIQHFSLSLYGNAWGLLGTDDEGSDIFTQLIYGARLSLIVGLVATFIGIGLGLVVGLLAGYLGKIVDEVLMRFTDMILVIPSLPLLIVIVAVLGPSLFNIILVLGFLGWMGFARIIRAQVLSLRERPFIEAAKASGAGTGYILTKHIFSNIVSLTYVNLALAVPSAIVGEAALSFLGLGDSTVVTWGRMLELAREGGGTVANLTWWWIIPPGIAIAAISLSFILLGYGLDSVFNPRLRRRR